MLNRLLIEILKEVGEGTAQPYTLTRVNDELMRFTTKDRDDYRIELEFLPNKNNSILFVSFAIENGGDEYGGYDAYIRSTNRGDIYRIMVTVIAAVKLQLKKFTTIDQIIMSPTKADEGDDRRLNLYLAYINSQIKPGSELDNWTISVEKNPYTAEETDIFLKRNK